MLSNQILNDKFSNLKYNPAISGTSLLWIGLLSTLLVRVCFIMETFDLFNQPPVVVKQALTQELMHELFDYKDGLLYWRVKLSNRVKVGSVAGCIQTLKGKKRRTIRLGRKLYFASRLIFLYKKGVLPEFIDHRDRDSMNDKIENLREATQTQNNKNKTSAKNSSSQYLGVCYSNYHKKWGARIKINALYKHVGYFEKEADAAIAYNEAAKIHHGEFASLNILPDLVEVTF